MTQGDILELEMDELNQHECMATMTALIKHMQKNLITPSREEVFFSLSYIFFSMLPFGVTLGINVLY